MSWCLEKVVGCPVVRCLLFIYPVVQQHTCGYSKVSLSLFPIDLATVCQCLTLQVFVLVLFPCGPQQLTTALSRALLKKWLVLLACSSSSSHNHRPTATAYHSTTISRSPPPAVHHPQCDHAMTRHDHYPWQPLITTCPQHPLNYNQQHHFFRLLPAFGSVSTNEIPYVDLVT